MARRSLSDAKEIGTSGGGREGKNGVPSKRDQKSALVENQSGAKKENVHAWAGKSARTLIGGGGTWDSNNFSHGRPLTLKTRGKRRTALWRSGSFYSWGSPAARRISERNRHRKKGGRITKTCVQMHKK